ncbi:TniQ family protein [Paraburkholderia azotifigens]|uniref:TniQ family protein n=1 Tax=Paraburkholderia azotifigens TaxID=2057004 RepID=UPI003CCC6AEA
MYKSSKLNAASPDGWPIDLPPRSLLFGVTPSGFDGATRENIVSFFRRTADAHGILPRSLAYHVLVPMMRLPSRYSEDLMAAECYHLDLCGLSAKAARWTDVLMQLTCRSDLHFLTLLPLKNFVSSYQLIETTNRFCPECYAEDERGNRPKYDRLLWAIRCVAACPDHELRLIAEPKVKNRHSLPYTVPGVSRCDGNSLAKRISAKASEYEVATARLVCDLIGDMPLFAQQEHTRTPEFLAHAANCLFVGNYAAFARHLGLSKSQMHGWIHEGILLSLEGVVRIAYALQCTMSDVLLGRMAPVSLREGYSMQNGLFNLKRSTGHRVPHQKLLASLSNFMRMNPTACAQDAARHLDVSPKFLRENFPEQNEALLCAARLNRRCIAQFRQDAKDSAYEKSYRTLAETGAYPCRRKVMKRLKEQGISLTFAQERRAQKRQSNGTANQN